MNTINLPENPMPITGHHPDFKKKAVFLSNVLSCLTDKANKNSIIHYAENLQKNNQSYDDFVASVLQLYHGPQFSASGSGFNAQAIISAINTAKEQTNTISANNINLAYERARTNFSTKNFFPINNPIIEAQKPKYLDFNKYKEQYLANVTNMISPNTFSIVPQTPDYITNIVKEATSGLDNITDYNQWTTQFNKQLTTAITNYNNKNQLHIPYTQVPTPTVFKLTTAQNIAYNSSLTTTPPQKPQQTQTQTQTQSQPAPQPAPIEPQQPQYDTYSPNTKNHEERIKKWMEHIGLGDKAQDMIDKYGVQLAHSIVQSSLMEPANITVATDGKFRSSKKSIQYFLDNEISEDKLANLPGVNADFVADSLASRPGAVNRIIAPMELQASAPTLNFEVPKIVLTEQEQHDPRAIYIASLKKELTIKGFKQEEISQAIDKALEATLKEGVVNDFELGTSGQWCGTFRHKLFNELDIENNRKGKYNYIFALEQKLHTSSLEGVTKGDLIINPTLRNAIAQVEGSINEFEVPVSAAPEELMAESDKEESRTDITNQRKTSGVDEPIVITEMPGKTWEEIVAATTPKPPANWDEFKQVSYASIKTSEGESLEPYFDCNGHPTIGIGMLIYRRDDIKENNTCLAGTSLAYKQDDIATATNIINDKSAYYMEDGKKVSLYSNEKDNTPNITSINGTVTIYDSKGNTVELERIPNAGAKIKKVNNVVIGKISKRESDKMFEKRLKIDYKRACNAIPNFKDMPTNIQIAAVHMCFGATSTFAPPSNNTNDYTDRSGFTYGEKRTPEELMEYINKYYKERGQVNKAIANTLSLANQEVVQIKHQLSLHNTVDAHSNQQTLLSQNQQQTPTDNSVFTLNKLQSGRYS